MSFLRELSPKSGQTKPVVGIDARAGPRSRHEKRVPACNATERDRVIADTDAKNDSSRYAESLTLLTHAITATPNDPSLVLAQAATLFAWRRCREARAAGLRAAALGLQTKALYLNLGWTCFAVGKIDEAEVWMRKATIADPRAADSHLNLAVVLQAQKRFAEAAACYEQALALGGDDFDRLLGLGSCHLGLGNLAAAEARFRSAIGLDGSRAVAWLDLGASLSRLGRFAEAQQAFAGAASVDKDDETDCFLNVAIGLADAGRVQEALVLYQKHLPKKPSPAAHDAYSHLLLKCGRLREGWTQHEFRLLNEPQISMRPDFRRPVWNGQNVHGKTVLLHVEQGFGDIIQFVRYAPLVKALGATVLLRVSRAMESSARAFPAIDKIVSRDEPPPPFDFYVYLLSLPRIFGTGLESIPADIPYLHAEPDKVMRWAKPLGSDDRLKIGLVWAGNPAHPNDKNRSVSLAVLAPLGEVEGVRWISLQKGEPAREAESAVSGLEVMNLGPELEDFRDTAAVISQLDLVLCVDTAVAHLAGALGKPVWVMVAIPADWRWLEGRDDSPWYPTLRLFRQSRRGEWEDVIERVKGALQEGVAAGTFTVPRVKPLPPLLLAQPPVVAIPSRAPGHRPGFSAVAECRDGIVQYLPDEAWVGDSLGWYGEYLQPQLDLLARLIRPGATVLEAGAGVGEHALFLAAVLGEAGHLFLYESRPVVKRILQQNLGANRISNVTLMRRTLGATGEAADPNAETLDELQLERLDWLKIKGSVSALDILDGGADTLWRLRPLLFLAAPDEAALTALASRVKEFSYRCWRMDTALFNPQNFNRRDTDIFSGRSALALLAIPEEIEVDVALDQCIEIS
jgi:tetratricopeptide (TPR) repeat protein